jgi:hypothetical protein
MADLDATFLRDQAEHCRWLAKDSHDPMTVQRLLRMAIDYEAKAKAIESGEALKDE